MGKKIIRLTEADLHKIVNRVISEQKTYTISGGKSQWKDIPTQNWVVIDTKGTPTIMKQGKELKLTPGMKILKNDALKIKEGDEIHMENNVHKYVIASLDNGVLDLTPQYD